jgi:hypothetical protein
MALRLSACLFVAFVIFLGHLQSEAASESPQGQAAEEARIVAAIVEVLPEKWTYQRTATGMVLRPKQQPVFVNTVNAEAPRPGESKDNYLRRHVVRIDYRITLEFAPKIAPGRVQDMIAENAAICKKIEKIRGTETFRQSKGILIPETPKEEQLVAEYKRLVGSLRRIPDGYLGETSVYIQPTKLGYARFLTRESCGECKGLRTKLAGLLSPYGNRQTTDNTE